MSAGDLVSVVMATRNSARHLAQAIESVRRQTYQPVELIVVDGDSTDGTEAIARTYGGLRFVRQPGRGLANAWNCGIAAARGPLVAFLDSDDHWSADKLALQAAELAADPGRQYVDGRVQFFADDAGALPPAFRAELLATPRQGYMPGTILVRRALFETLGAFDERLAIAPDIDWFARAKDRGVPAGAIPQTVLYKRVHESNFSLRASSAVPLRREILAVLRQSVARRRPAP